MYAGLTVIPIALTYGAIQGKVDQAQHILQLHQRGIRTISLPVGHLDALFTPLYVQISPGRTLVLNLQAPLASIPIEAMAPAPGVPRLADHLRTLRAHPAGALRGIPPYTKRKVRLDPGTVYVGGNPGLTTVSPVGETEILHFYQRYQIITQTGAAFTREGLLRELEGKQVIHLVCHGHNYGSQDHKQGIGGCSALFTQDGYVLGEEIASLDLSTCELAILACCDAGKGKQFGTHQIQSIANYFFEAGVQSILCALDIANDEESAPALTTFYEQLESSPRFMR